MTAPALAVPAPPAGADLTGALILDSECVPLIVKRTLSPLTLCDACCRVADYVVCDVHERPLSPSCQECLDLSRLDATSPDTWFIPTVKPAYRAISTR